MIKAQNIHKSFGSLEVLKGVSLNVSPAEVVSIVGPSGAGKTTLLQILGTLAPMDSGSLTINSVQIESLGDKQLSDFRNRQIGFVFQFHNLLPEFSALENVMMPALIARRNHKEAEQEATNLLKMMNLSERATHKPSALSGGEQQRVAIARALINHPALLLADEPSGNLDTKNREEIHSLFFRLRDELGQTTLIVTHDEGLAAMADRKISMLDGKIL
ncbi:MAG: ABC transporter ATP-binding protein [Alistipes sp.]|nr:ABC transporter ATP-binding protein [Alistipes sp.]MBR7097172.1 ABC transporter ATP-binding protein [Alistipes sp.]